MFKTNESLEETKRINSKMSQRSPKEIQKMNLKTRMNINEDLRNVFT